MALEPRPFWLPWLSRGWRKAREELTWAGGTNPGVFLTLPLPPPSLGQKRMELAFPLLGSSF